MRPYHQQTGSETARARGATGYDPTADPLAELLAEEPELIRALAESADRVTCPDVESILAGAFQAVRMHPHYADLHYFTASAAFELGKLTDAEALLQRALELNPKYREALILSARVAQAAENRDRAIRYLNLGIAAGADYPDVHLMLANLYHAGGETDSARQAYERSLELNPTLPEARAGLAALAPTGPCGGAE
jgi:tetratricopeptide (TPR) repeat protein